MTSEHYRLQTKWIQSEWGHHVEMLMASLSQLLPQKPYSTVGCTCLCPPGVILVQGLCKLLTRHHTMGKTHNSKA